MKICIDLLWLRNGEIGGLEYFVRTLLSAIKKIDTKNIYYLLLTKSDSDTFKEYESPNLKIISFDFNNTNRILRVLKEETVIKKIVIKENIDLVYFPCHNRTLTKLSCKTISTIHDIRFMYHKEGFSKIQLLYLKLLHLSIKKNSDYVIFVSDVSKKSFIEKIGNRANLYTIYPGVRITSPSKTDKSQKNILEKLNLQSRDYIYTVSSMMSHKNLITLLKAIKILAKERPTIKLVITGLNGDSTAKIREIIKKDNLENNIIITGYISDEDKQTLYDNANIFVFPSYFEGFGVPPVEAIYSKLPVIVSDIPIMKEILRNNQKIFYIKKYMDPYSWASRISTILDGNRENYIPDDSYIEGLKKRYDPEEVAKAYISIFEGKIEKKYYNITKELEEKT